MMIKACMDKWESDFEAAAVPEEWRVISDRAVTGGGVVVTTAGRKYGFVAPLDCGVACSSIPDKRVSQTTWSMAEHDYRIIPWHMVAEVLFEER